MITDFRAWVRNKPAEKQRSLFLTLATVALVGFLLSALNILGLAGLLGALGAAAAVAATLTWWEAMASPATRERLDIFSDTDPVKRIGLIVLALLAWAVLLSSVSLVYSGPILGCLNTYILLMAVVVAVSGPGIPLEDLVARAQNVQIRRRKKKAAAAEQDTVVAAPVVTPVNVAMQDANGQVTYVQAVEGEDGLMYVLDDEDDDDIELITDDSEYDETDIEYITEDEDEDTDPPGAYTLPGYTNLYPGHTHMTYTTD